MRKKSSCKVYCMQNIRKDLFNEIVPKIKSADCIVFASPLYFRTVSSGIKAFIERFYCIAEEPNPPLERYEKYPNKDCALLMTFADNFFWIFGQAVSYYQFTLVNYIGFHSGIGFTAECYQNACRLGELLTDSKWGQHYLFSKK